MFSNNRMPIKRFQSKKVLIDPRKQYRNEGEKKFLSLSLPLSFFSPFGTFENLANYTVYRWAVSFTLFIFPE